MRQIGIVCVFLLLIGSIVFAPVLAQDSAQDVPWWNDRVFYEIFVRSFYDSDGDGIGDIQGIIQRLDYLNDGDPTTNTDLGITGIWLMPINPSPSYHGYDVTDYFDINPDYGTLDDFMEFLDAAHERGIAVIMDLVVNHTSVEHPWFTASQAGGSDYDDWYIWEDTSPGYRGPWSQVVWHPSGGRFYYGLFWSGMPDLNYRNPDVTQQIYDIADFWLEDVGVDGFRIDAAKHIVEDGQAQENTPITRQWLTGFTAHVRTTNPDALIVGELSNNPMIQTERYIDEESFDIAFEFELQEDMVGSSLAGNKRNIERVVRRVLRAYPSGRFATFLANHDQTRIMNTFGGDVGVNRVAAALLLTGPGVPFLYYGEEIGMGGTRPPDENVRRPFHWDDSDTVGFTSGRPWQPAGNSVGSVASMTDDPDSLLSHYRRLIQLRNDHEALRRGETVQVDTSQRRVYSILRYTDDEILLIVINLDEDVVEDWSLTLEEGPLAGITSAGWILGEGDLAIPEINADGGFDSYTPFATLEGHSVQIIRLQ